MKKSHKIAAAKAGVSTQGSRGECAQRICTRETHSNRQQYNDNVKFKSAIIKRRRLELMTDILEKNIANGSVPVNEKEKRLLNIKASINKM